MRRRFGWVAAALAAAVAMGAAGAASAHGQGAGPGQGMMGQGMMGQGMMGADMGSGMRDQGMAPPAGSNPRWEHHGPDCGAMGHRQDPRWRHYGPGGDMGPGMMGPGMMGPGMMGPGFGMRVTPIRHLTGADVRHFLAHRLAWQGYKRLKVGSVEDKDEDTIVAKIVTGEGALVQELAVDRHSGLVREVE